MKQQQQQKETPPRYIRKVIRCQRRCATQYDQDTNRLSTSTEVGFKLGIHQTTALDYIKRFGFGSKLSD
ncbi:UNVERIFIED_CONTAM: hypothetical protein NCL1_47687 [Trichonephila clavipes]